MPRSLEVLPRGWLEALPRGKLLERLLRGETVKLLPRACSGFLKPHTHIPNSAACMSQRKLLQGISDGGGDGAATMSLEELAAAVGPASPFEGLPGAVDLTTGAGVGAKATVCFSFTGVAAGPAGAASLETDEG